MVSVPLSLPAQLSSWLGPGPPWCLLLLQTTVMPTSLNLVSQVVQPSPPYLRHPQPQVEPLACAGDYSSSLPLSPLPFLSSFIHRTEVVLSYLLAFPFLDILLYCSPHSHPMARTSTLSPSIIPSQASHRLTTTSSLSIHSLGTPTLMMRELQGWLLSSPPSQLTPTPTIPSLAHSLKALPLSLG